MITGLTHLLKIQIIITLELLMQEIIYKVFKLTNKHHFLLTIIYLVGHQKKIKIIHIMIITLN